MILQYYMDKEDEDYDEDYDDEIDIIDVNHELKYPMEDIIELDKYSIEKLLSLYNIKLESNLDQDIKTWTCEDQLNFSWPYKEQFLKNKIDKEGIIKCNTIVQVIMASVKDRNKKIYPIFQTKYIILRTSEDVNFFLRQSMVDIKSRIGRFPQKTDQKTTTERNQIHGSDCVDLGIEYEKLNVVKIKYVFANGYIELPNRIINTKSCINIKNVDNKCFLYCHLLHERYRLNGFTKIQNPERLHGEKAFTYGNTIINSNYENIVFPIPFNVLYTVKKIEEQNQIKINIFEYKEGKKHDIIRIYHSKTEYENCMNLLVISDNTQKKYHYIYIKNLNRLLKSCINYNGVKFCQNCFKHFSNNKAFNSMNHKCNYKKNPDEMPENMTIVNNKLIKCPLNSYIRPFNLKHTMFLPWVMYCDFESILINSEDEKHHDKREHKLSSYCYNLICRERPSFNRFKIYRGTENDSVIDVFLNDVKNVLNHIKQTKKKFYALPMLTDEEMKQHKRIKKCQFCGGKFDKTNKRIQHHNHVNGEYIATTCKTCNSKIKTDNTLYIVFHYLKGYDIHYIIEKIYDHFNDSNINILGNNSSSIFHVGIQNYIKIIDSHEFIPASLTELSNNLKNEDIHYIREMLDKYGHDFVKKDIFPFRYIDDFSKHNENTFSDIKYFDSVDQKTYEKYRKYYYSKFNSFGEYSNYYLEKDVLLMSDIMESYRTLFMDKYQTELFSHYSINSLKWEILKKWNPIQIKILDNYKIYNAFQTMMRGGLCDIGGTRYAYANNRYMENYDPSQESSYIMHYDINSMYGFIMSTFPLPYDAISFLNNEEIRDFNIWDYDKNSEYGYILNIDISLIDIKYHDYYNDLPIFPYKRKTFKKDISDYQKEILEKNNKPFIATEKLISDFYAKKDYTVHYLTLQFYLKLPGFNIQNINYIIRFRQAKYMKDYIKYNHKNRIESTNENDKRIYKLLINSTFGRSLLNKEKI